MLKRTFCALLLMLLAAAVPAAATPLETLMGLAPGTRADIPIIMYHALDDTPGNRWEITSAQFEADLQYLSKHGYNAVYVQDLINFVHYGKALPEKPIVLSFDDGRSPTIDIVIALMEKYDSRITMAIIGKEADRYTALASGRHPHMTWPQVAAAAKSGRVEITSHTYDLHGPIGARKKSGETDAAYTARFLADLEKFAAKLHDAAGIRANSLVYPLGEISDISDEIIKSAGYLASLSCFEKTSSIAVGDTDSLYSMGRYLRPPGVSSDTFFTRVLK